MTADGLEQVTLCSTEVEKTPKRPKCVGIIESTPELEAVPGISYYIDKDWNGNKTIYIDILKDEENLTTTIKKIRKEDPKFASLINKLENDLADTKYSNLCVDFDRLKYELDDPKKLSRLQKFSAKRAIEKALKHKLIPKDKLKNLNSLEYDDYKSISDFKNADTLLSKILNFTPISIGGIVYYKCGKIFTNIREVISRKGAPIPEGCKCKLNEDIGSYDCIGDACYSSDGDLKIQYFCDGSDHGHYTTYIDHSYLGIGPEGWASIGTTALLIGTIASMLLGFGMLPKSNANPLTIKKFVQNHKKDLNKILEKY